MKKLTLLTLTLMLTAAMAVTTATAQQVGNDIPVLQVAIPIPQQYVHTDSLWGHEHAIFAIAFKDDETLISGGRDHYLREWDLTNGWQNWRQEVGGRIYTVALSSLDSEFIAHEPHFIAYGGFDNNNIRMRYSHDGDWRGRVKGHTDDVYSLAFKPNSYLLASGSYDNTIRIWDVSDKDAPRHVRTLQGHTDTVYSVAWSPDGSTLASASGDNTVRLWNPDNGTNLAVLRGHTDAVYCLAWSPDGRILASGAASEDYTIRLWDPDTHGTLRVLRGHIWSINALAFHPNGQTLASGGDDRTIYLWNPNTGALKYTIRTGRSYPEALAFSPNGQILAGTGTNGIISLYRLLPVDVTGNGVVDVADLVEVAINYGQFVDGNANQRADVNGDGVVDIDDILAVLQAVEGQVPDGGLRDGEITAFAPIKTRRALLQASDVQRWIRDAKAANADPAGIAALERLLTKLNRRDLPVPKKTVLLANYPNPFNPETWIPYQLSETAEVTVTIHASNGKLVRTLELGQVPAGAYADKNRAAYWDGRNAQGEPVASGVYFYTLTAGDFKATRKMVIRK